MRIHCYYAYIVTNTYHNVLYTGITNDLIRRCHEHKNKLIKGITEKYNINKLVYYEIFDFVDQAIHREKQIKGYSRKKKNTLIFTFNPEWIDLYDNGTILNLTAHKSIPAKGGPSPLEP